jgi:hypothetical protein
MPDDSNLLSLNASLAIPTRALHFEDSGLHRRTPVRPVLFTGQTGQTHRSDRFGTATAPSSVLRSWLCGSTKEPSGFLLNHRKPRELGVAYAIRPLRPLGAILELWHILQNSLKHFKTTQREKCAESQGTQLCC